jgi:hypothetical protein
VIEDVEVRTALLIVFAASFAVFSTLLLPVDNDKLKYGGLLAFIVMVALTFRKSGLPWWVASLMFGLAGVCHLIALWALYPPAHAAGAVPAFESFGPGYLVMGAFFYVRHRWIGRARA